MTPGEDQGSGAGLESAGLESAGLESAGAEPVGSEAVGSEGAGVESADSEAGSAGAGSAEAGGRRGEPVSGAGRPSLTQLFGEVLPDTTRDERDDDTNASTEPGGWGSASGDPGGWETRDEELLRDVPPHHHDRPS